MKLNYNLSKKISNTLNKMLNETQGVLKLNKNKKFDYVEGRKICDECGGYRGGEMIEGMMCECGSMTEELKGGQKKLDVAKPYGKLTKDDFAKLRKGAKKHMEEKECMECGSMEEENLYELELDREMEEGETEESKEFAYAAKMAKRKGEKTFELDGETFDVKESYRFTESEMVNFIERIVEEEKKFRAGKEPKGYTEYNRVHKQDKKTNEKNVQDVVEKMKKYLKNGSKGEFSFEPKIFPAGNGELAEMEKMAYTPSDAVGEYIENFTAAALENIDYDTFEPNKEWVDDNIVGSSKTGNNPKWANAVETPTNKRRKEIKDKNLWRKTELKAYNKAPQPVYKETAGNSKDGSSNILRALESTEKKTNKLNEEFSRMKNLISYSNKTQ